MLFTIIIPTYNRKDLVTKAIDSVINQKESDRFWWEIFVIDDGSIDGTAEVIQSYTSRYSNIQYVWQENAGVGAARNKGLDMLSPESDYVLLLDSDDELLDDCLVRCCDSLLELESRWHTNIASLAFYCEDQTGRFLGDRGLFDNWYFFIDYQTILTGRLSFEIASIVRSSVFYKNSNLRYPTDIVTETILNIKLAQTIFGNQMIGVLCPFVGRMYRRHYWGPQITTTIHSDRFRKNAIGNERILEIIAVDIPPSVCAEYHFRSGVNWVMAGESCRGRKHFVAAFRVFPRHWKSFVFFLLSPFPALVRFLFSIYIRTRE